MTAYRISADALLRLALIADGAPGANSDTILLLLKEAEPIAVQMPDVAAGPALEGGESGEGFADKPAKPE